MFRTRSQSGSSRRRNNVEAARRSFSGCLPHLSRSSSSRGSGSLSPNRICEHRIYSPDNLGIGDDEASADRDLERGIEKELLEKIQRCYERVKLARIGFCFGLLDPVSNIVVGDAFCFCEDLLNKAKLEEEEEEEEEVEKDEEEDLPPSEPIGSQYERSLDGLVAFLVALFPYLTVYRAMWYLNKADLDPLVAARLIISHRGMEQTFGTLSDTTVAAVGMALSCAAAAAQLRNPRQFAAGWKLLSPSMRKLATMLHPSRATHDPSQLPLIIKLLSPLPARPPLLCLEDSWDLAKARHNKHPEMPLVPRPTMRRMLLTTIHGCYLKALAWMPKGKLRSRYHRSLLQVGHCYGPMDPVSNIIVNTIWYDQVYPPTLEKKVEIEAISTNSLLRIAVRSLYGLISFLCTCDPALTPGEAMHRLHMAGADLQKAYDPSLLAVGVEEEAYAAAAKAAYHPKPLQQAKFLGPSNSMIKAFSQVLRRQKPEKARPFLLEYFPTIIASNKPEENTNIEVLGPWDYSYVTRILDDFWKKHTRALRIAQSAIDMYSKQHEVPKYDLHVICGVNEFVGGSLDAAPFGRTYSCSHINFLATKTAGALPELFFAECPNAGSKGRVGFCCPVAMPLPGTEQARCPYCELAGSRIVHPAKECFQGRNRMFEKILRRKGAYSEGRTTNDIISGSHKETLWVDYLEEDQIYRDYKCDNDKVEEKFPRDDMF